MGIIEFRRSENTLCGQNRVFGIDWSFSKSDAAELPERRFDLEVNPFFLKIFHINDLHGNIYSFNSSGTAIPVFTKIVDQVEKERIAVEKLDNSGVLFLSAGDDSIGTSLDYLTGYDGKGFITHPVYSAFSLAGVDATVLGNHDLDTGMSTLKLSVSENSEFPVLSANLDHKGELDGFVYPGAIVVVKGIRIGIIGLTTPGQVRTRPGSEYTVRDPYEAVTQLYDVLTPLCDSIIILSHLGYKLGSTFATVKMTGDVELASRLGDYKIDTIVGGHTHDFLNIQGLEAKNLVNGIPVLQAGYNGLFYGKGTLKISDKNKIMNSSIFPTGTLSGSSHFDTAFSSSTAGQHMKDLQIPLGVMNLQGKFSNNECEINNNGAESPIANFITSALASEVRQRGRVVDLAAIDSSNMVSVFNFRKKSVNIIDLYRLMPYADTIVAFSLTGKDLEKILTSNALRLDSDYISNITRGFIHFSRELRYTINKTDRTISNITINNIPIEDCYERLFIIAAPNFVQGLGANWEKSKEMHNIVLHSMSAFKKEDTGLYVRNELLNYIKKHGVTENSGFLTDSRIKII